MRSKDFLFAIGLAACLLSLLIGLYVGAKVTSGYYDPEIKRLSDSLDKANEAKKTETGYWLGVLKGLANGEQFEGVDIKHGRPSVGD